jgi:carboxypeptidase D
MALHANLDETVRPFFGAPSLVCWTRRRCSFVFRFPEYKPRDNKISIWSESYGGHYGPTFANFFAKQTQKIADGSVDQTAVPLRLDTVGIINGCIDILTQIRAYPQMAYNNTYGIQVITEAEYNAALNSFPECRRRVEACQSLADAEDPDGLGNVEAVNAACSDAYYYCIGSMSVAVGRGVCLVLIFRSLMSQD